MTSSARTCSPTEDQALPPPDEITVWTLAAQADHEELARLQSFLLAHRGSPVRIDADALRRTDTLLLQLIVAACRDWRERGLSFRLADAPDRVTGMLPLLGLRPDMIGIEAR